MEFVMRNVLYHFTTEDNFREITKENCLKISKEWGIRAISLTRDMRLNHRCVYLRKSQVRITLDKDKLSYNYRITPFDFFSKHPVHGNFYKEAEEIIKKDIINLNKYMLEVVHFK